MGRRVRRHGPDRSVGDCREADGGIIAQRGDCFQCHVAAALNRPLVVLFEQDGADQAGHGVLIREDADHFGSPLDLAIDPFERIGRVQLGAVRGREAHVGEHVSLGLVEEGKLRQFRTELVGDAPPLRLCRLRVVLGKGGADEGGDDAPSALAGMRQRVAHEVHAAALPSGVENLADRGFDPLMGVGDDELDAAQAAAGELS